MEVIESIVTEAIEVEDSTTTVTTLETEKSKAGEMCSSARELAIASEEDTMSLMMIMMAQIGLPTSLSYSRQLLHLRNNRFIMVYLTYWIL